MPLANNVDSYEEERKRLTFNGTFQWAPGEDTEAIVDVLYTKRDLEHSQTSAIFVSLPLAGNVNPDESLRVPAASFDGNTLPVISSALGNEMVSDVQDNSDELLTLGLNLNRQMGVWNLNFDASYAKAEGELAFDRAVVVNDAGAGGEIVFDYAVDAGGFTVTDSGTADLSDPANYFIRNGRVTRTYNDDEEYAFQFDVTREIDSNFLSAVKTGVRFVTGKNRWSGLILTVVWGPAYV